MSDKGLKTREGIKKRLLDLAVEANSIKDNELALVILAAYNRCDDNVTLANYMGLSLTSDTKSTSGNVSGPHLSVIELKDNGPYLNGKRIEGLIDMNIDSKTGDLTKVVIKLAANVHGIDDIKQEHSFYSF